MKVAITGLAGMIGFHLAKALCVAGHEVVGFDSFNDYYEVSLKQARANILSAEYGVNVDLAVLEQSDLTTWLGNNKPDIVIHLAAYANPRHALEFPQLYIDTNITGTQRLIEACEKVGISKVVYASSSCVMHGQPLPWNEQDRPALQNNPYGWSKRVNECQFAHSKIAQTVGLRFFTVYGPYGRPDMALFLFAKGIIEQTPIIAYNNGNMARDFTYVEDIVQGLQLVINKTMSEDTPLDDIYNIGYGAKVQLMDFIHHIEHQIGKKAIINYQPAHPADVPATWSDTSKLRALGYNPSTPIELGVERFVEWYRKYYNV